MRESIAGAWLYSIVIIFMMLLVAFISISINYNKTYKLKTAVVNIIEQNQGINNRSVANIAAHLKNNGYTNGKVCEKLFKGNGQKYIEINNGVASSVKTKGTDAPGPASQVCVTRKRHDSSVDVGGAGISVQYDYFYDVYMFFSFSLPVFGDIFRFNVIGTTNSIIYPIDSNAWGD
jgi:hypothetical protein